MQKGSNVKQETKDKMSKSHTGKKHTEESKHKMSIAKLEYWHIWRELHAERKSQL